MAADDANLEWRFNGIRAAWTDGQTAEIALGPAVCGVTATCQLPEPSEANRFKVHKRMRIAAGPRAFIIVIGIGALFGASAAQALYYRFIPFPSVLSWEYWNLHLALEGAIAGALIAHLGWVLSDVRMRLRRSAAIAVATNAVVWVLFLIVTPPLTASQFATIQAERDRGDADSGIDLVTHEPVIVAGRMLSTYGPDAVSERLLQIFASPAIEWTAFLTVPWKYGPARATRRESYIIAAGGFFLSTAFWAAFATAVSSRVRSWRRRGRER